MKKGFIKHFLIIYAIVNILYLLLALSVFRRTNNVMPFILLEIGAIMIAAILSVAYTIYKLEKGYPIVNVIIAYVLVLPSLFIVRLNFGQLLFRSLTFLYLIFIMIGIIYSIALFIASKRYKKEVDDLNELLHRKENQNKDS